MTMTYKITFADLGWYEVKAELPAEKLKIEKTEVLHNG